MNPQVRHPATFWSGTGLAGDSLPRLAIDLWQTCDVPRMDLRSAQLRLPGLGASPMLTRRQGRCPSCGGPGAGAAPSGPTAGRAGACRHRRSAPGHRCPGGGCPGRLRVDLASHIPVLRINGTSLRIAAALVRESATRPPGCSGSTATRHARAPAAKHRSPAPVWQSAAPMLSRTALDVRKRGLPEPIADIGPT